MSKKKKRRHRLGGPSSQNVAVGQRELIVHTVAQDPNVQLRINPAGVEKMSDVLLRFAEAILDRLAPLDDKKATLLFATKFRPQPQTSLICVSAKQTSRPLQRDRRSLLSLYS